MRRPNRREFLALGGAAVFAARGKANPLGLPIGIQPYTVRQEMQKDLAGTLKQLAAMGYGAVEVGDPFYGAKPSELRDLLKSLGLSSPSGFYPSPKTKDDWARSIERAKALDVTYLITDGWGKTLDALKQRADQFNELGAVCKKAGTVVAYHNHNFEYKTVDGVVAYDEFLKLTDPELVTMEMDCFWTVYAGRDPVEYFQKHPGRFALLHIKDLKPGFAPSTEWPKAGTNPFTEVGRGSIDYQRIFAAAGKGGVKHYHVEQDRCDRPPLESARISCEYLKKLKA